MEKFNPLLRRVYRPGLFSGRLRADLSRLENIGSPDVLEELGLNPNLFPLAQPRLETDEGEPLAGRKTDGGHREHLLVIRKLGPDEVVDLPRHGNGRPLFQVGESGAAAPLG